MSRVVSIFSGLLLMLGGLLVFSPPASAAATGAYGCSGTEIDTYPNKTSSGAIWGYIHLYYDSATGNNCAVNVANSAGYYGTPTYKGITMSRCVAGSVAGKGCSTDLRRDDPAFGDNKTLYSYYAGPVSFNAAGRCILLSGVLLNPNATNAASVSTGAVHCG
jgi:hypothetical protein